MEKDLEKLSKLEFQNIRNKIKDKGIQVIGKGLKKLSKL